MKKQGLAVCGLICLAIFAGRFCASSALWRVNESGVVGLLIAFAALAGGAIFFWRARRSPEEKSNYIEASYKSKSRPQ